MHFGDAFLEEVGLHDGNIFLQDFFVSGEVLTDHASHDTGLIVATAIGDGGGDSTDLERACEGFSLADGHHGEFGRGGDGTRVVIFPRFASGKHSFIFLGEKNAAFGAEAQQVEGINHGGAPDFTSHGHEVRIAGTLDRFAESEAAVASFFPAANF